MIKFWSKRHDGNLLLEFVNDEKINLDRRAETEGRWKEGGGEGMRKANGLKTWNLPLKARGIER